MRGTRGRAVSRKEATLRRRACRLGLDDERRRCLDLCSWPQRETSRSTSPDEATSAIRCESPSDRSGDEVTDAAAAIFRSCTDSGGWRWEQSPDPRLAG